MGVFVVAVWSRREADGGWIYPLAPGGVILGAIITHRIAKGGGDAPAG